MKKKKWSLIEGRDVLKPIVYPWALDAYQKQQQMHWLPDEVPMVDDVKCFKNTLKSHERDFIVQVLRMFTTLDVKANDYYATYVLRPIQENPYRGLAAHPEVRFMVSAFQAAEANHAIAYDHINATLGLPDELHSEFMQYVEMKDKYDYLCDVPKPDDLRSLARSMAIFSGCMEGVILFSAFAMLYNFARHGKMNGVGQIISWSIKDENLHSESMAQLHNAFVKENRKEIWDDAYKREIYDAFEKLVSLEDVFVDSAFKIGPQENLTPEGVKGYIRFLAGKRLSDLGLKDVFKIKKNPLPWMEEIIGSVEHTSFFENKPTAYSTGTLQQSDWMKVWASE